MSARNAGAAATGDKSVRPFIVPSVTSASRARPARLGNDVTLRDLQAKDGQWTRAKGFDTSCPLGPWIETEVDPAGLRLRTLVNGEVRQDARTSDLAFGPAELVSFVSTFMTLLPGDVVLTGTPAGVGPLAPGDRVEVEIEGIGTLANAVAAP